MILTLKFWRVFGVTAYIWRDLGLPPLIFENRYLSHFQRNAVILVKTDKIGYKQELAPHPDNERLSTAEAALLTCFWRDSWMQRYTFTVSLLELPDRRGG